MEDETFVGMSHSKVTHSKDSLLFFLRTPVQFLALTMGGLQSPVTLAPRNIIHLSGFHGHLLAYAPKCVHAHMNKDL